MRLTGRDIHEFNRDFPSAMAWIRNRELLNEFRHLETNYTILNEWEKNRHKELEEICGFTKTDVTRADVADIFFDQD